MGASDDNENDRCGLARVSYYGLRQVAGKYRAGIRQRGRLPELAVQGHGEESHRLHAALARASTQQEQARSNDVVGVIFIGLPVSTLSGDNIAPEGARLKGEQEAVRKAIIGKGC